MFGCRKCPLPPLSPPHLTFGPVVHPGTCCSSAFLWLLGFVFLFNCAFSFQSVFISLGANGAIPFFLLSKVFSFFFNCHSLFSVPAAPFFVFLLRFLSRLLLLHRFLFFKHISWIFRALQEFSSVIDSGVFRSIGDASFFYTFHIHSGALQTVRTLPVQVCRAAGPRN